MASGPSLLRPLGVSDSAFALCVGPALDEPGLDLLGLALP